MDKNLLAEHGIDYDKGVKNSMNDPEFFRMLLSMFLEDTCFPRARTAFAAKNQKELFSCMHELKGVSGNAALTGLYNTVGPLVELLRDGASDFEEVDRMFQSADAAYERTCEGIRLALQ